ncbi:auxin-induced in root cultures protein 12-like [Silene latifolia]|uniref:auxin-induced in root cultures protein 12-like n=1 Tax=Silene latifolia TaxID=37657 RepID=UPI003D76C458
MAAFLRIMLMTLCLITLLPHPTNSQPQCKSMTFSKNQLFAKCMDLPTLNATLHWTYDTSTSALSMAYTAPASSKDSWIAWALNPTGSGMLGAQAIATFSPGTIGLFNIVQTVDITSYHSIRQGPLSYNVTGLSCEASLGKLTVFGTWALPAGEPTVNMVWQIGPVTAGRMDAHAMEPDNFKSKMKIDLSSGVDVETVNGSAVAPAPWTLESAKQKGGAVKELGTLFM